MSRGFFLGDLVSPAVSGVKTLVLVAIAAAVLIGVLAFLRKRERDSKSPK